MSTQLGSCTLLGVSFQLGSKFEIKFRIIPKVNFQRTLKINVSVVLYSKNKQKYFLSENTGYINRKYNIWNNLLTILCICPMTRIIPLNHCSKQTGMTVFIFHYRERLNIKPALYHLPCTMSGFFQLLPS